MRTTAISTTRCGDAEVRRLVSTCSGGWHCSTIARAAFRILFMPSIIAGTALPSLVDPARLTRRINQLADWYQRPAGWLASMTGRAGGGADGRLGVSAVNIYPAIS
jgi:hypothetical protein